MLEVNSIELYCDVLKVLKGISFQVPSGAIVALLGSNGAGKSTVLKAISNTLDLEDGEMEDGAISFDGQRLDRLGECSPQPPGVFARDSPRGPAALHVPGEHPQHLAEGQVGIADAGIGVAVSLSDEQVWMRLHRLPGELTRQRRLAPAWAAGDEGHPTLARQRRVEVPMQLCQLVLPGDKDWSFDFCWFFFPSEKGGEGNGVWECGSMRGRCGSRDFRFHRARACGPDAYVQRRRLRRRGEVQLLFKGPHTRSVLAQGSRAPPSLGV